LLNKDKQDALFFLHSFQ